MSTSETPHLLSVEDNKETQTILKHLLEEEYQLTFVSSVEEAAGALASDGPFDLLLVDINLGPGKSGVELLHKIEDRENVGEVPAIAVTAYAMPGDREDLLDKGFDGYVSKPFTRAELIETIEQMLGAG